MKMTRQRLAEIVMEELNGIMEKEDPCWKGYEMIGMKDKGGKQVPNCVPLQQEVEGKCTKTTKKASSDAKGKKWTKCVKDGDGYKRIHWGQKGVRVTGDSGNTKRKKSFRARHGCSKAKPGTAKYQACKDW